jgi:hypothetical protein
VLLNKVAYDFCDEEEKTITANAIDKVNADINISLQEVESLRLLDKFDKELLKETEYNYKMLIDGKDPRRINVALMSKYPIVSAKTHRNELSSLSKKTWLFSRDCLKVEIDVDGKPIFLYVNHLKSMLDMNCKKRRRNT